MPDQERLHPDRTSLGQSSMELIDGVIQAPPSGHSWANRLFRVLFLSLLLLVACALLAIIAVPDLAEYGNRFSKTNRWASRRPTEPEEGREISRNTRRNENVRESPYSQSELKALIKDLGGSWSSTSERVNLTGPQITDENLQVVQWVPRLSKLNLSGTQVSDDGLKSLIGRNDLEELNLSGTPITNAGLVQLLGLPRLRYLRLTGTQITDDGISTLKDVSGLKALEISDTQITQAGLNQFQEMKNLRFLYISKGQFDAEAIEDLSAALPDCRIIEN